MDGERRYDDMPNLAEEVFASSNFESEEPMKIPSPSFLTAGGKIIAHEGRRLLRSAFPVPGEYSNPAGFLQGGYITTLMDDTFGPLSYLAAGRPAVTLNLSTTFLRPVPVTEEYLIVEAEVVSRGRTVLTMSGRVENSRGKLVATATSINQVMVS
jgi:uncharacterized protein (TIGR00369 family)